MYVGLNIIIALSSVILVLSENLELLIDLKTNTGISIEDIKNLLLLHYSSKDFDEFRNVQFFS